MKRIFKRLLTLVLSFAIFVVSLNGIVSLDVFALTGNTDYVDYGGIVYYVDSSKGNDSYNGTSEYTPWKTLEKVNEQVFMPGDQILFKSGSVWNGQLAPQGSGTSGAPITIGKYGGTARPILNGNTNAVDGADQGSTILIHDVEYYEIYDLEITNKVSSSQAFGYGIKVSVADMGAAEHYVVEGCYVHHIVGNASPSIWKTMQLNGGEYDGMYITKGAIQFEVSCGPAMIPTYFDGVYINNNTIADSEERTGINISSEWDSEIYTGCADNDLETCFSVNINISNNIFYNIAAAITIFTVDGSVGEGCIVENNVSYSNNNGNSFWVFWSASTIDLVYQNNEVYDQYRMTGSDDGVFDVDGQSVGTVFQYNYTHHNCGPAYVFCEAEFTSTLEYPKGLEPSYVKASTFRYNISYNDNWRFYRERGTFFNNQSENCYFYNNLMYADGYDVMFMDMSVEEAYVYNNIFYHTGKGNDYLNDYKSNKELGLEKLKVNKTVDEQLISLSDKTNGDKLNAIINWGVDVDDKQMLYLRNNCFYNLSIPLPKSSDTVIVENNITADPRLNLDGINGDSDSKSNLYFGVLDINTVRNNGMFQLKDDSPCIGTGKLISDNGGRDFYGNLVSNTQKPDIGPHQKNAVSSTPDSITLKTPTDNEISTETVVLNWEETAADADFNKYIVYVNGEAHDTILSNQRKTEDYIHRFYKGNVEIRQENSITLYNLKPATQYEIYIVGYSGDGKDANKNIASNKLNITTDSFATGENKLKVEDFKIYSYDLNNYNPQEITHANIGDVIMVKVKVTDGSGRPVVGALVKVNFNAVGVQYEKFDVGLTDRTGYAKVGIIASVLPGIDFKYDVNVYSVTKQGYVAADTTTKTITATGFDYKYNGNLLNNSNFEVVLPNGLPKSWQIINSSSVQVIENEGPNGDENIVDVRSQSSVPSQINQTIKGVPNGVYTLTAWVRNNNTTSTFGVDKNGEKISVSLPLNEEWNRVILSNVTVTTNVIMVYLTVPQFSDYSVYTQICNIELTRNLMYDTGIKTLKDSDNLTLPTSFYYATEDGVKVDVGDTNLTDAVENNLSLKAVNVSYYRGPNYTNGIYINSKEAFNFKMGQFKNNLAAGKYTFSASTMSTGGINGYLVIRDGVSGGVLGSSTIQSSVKYVTSQVTAEITSGSAYVELVFEGQGDRDKYIELLELSFANRSDLPTTATMTVLPGQNLMNNLNGDFEQDGKATNNIPIGWYLNDYKGNFKAYVSDEACVSGDFSMKCTLDEDFFSHNELTQGGATPLSEFTNLPAGTYTFSFWYKGTIPFAMGVRTNRGADRYVSNVKDTSDTWQKETIENIVVDDGTLYITNYFVRTEEHPKEMLWAYIDNISLTLNSVNYAPNGSVEAVLSDAPAEWKVTSSEGFAALISANEAVEGSKCGMAVLPGTDSAISVNCGTDIFAKTGNYMLSGFVRGNGIITFKVETDKTTQVKTLTVNAPEKWEEFLITDIEIDSVIKSVSFDVVNSNANTSSFVCIDALNFTTTINSQIVAKTLPSVKAVALGENFVLPEPLVEGYVVSIIDSSDKDIIALDGTVTIPDSNKFITLTFKVVNENNPSDIATVSRIVTVYGFE